ncbi:MAG TPA: ATP-binding protein [Thermoanaerobaculia bacterium]|nr:ATP-binding protein [Thermoanaerobaculia bacterium]
MDSLTRSLRFLTIIRLVVAGTIVLSSVLIQASAGLSLRLGPIYAVGGAAVVLSGIWVAVRRALRPVQEAYLQLGGDVFLVTALVYFSGASDSVFTFLYLVVIAVAAFFLLRPGALLVASLASILYGLTIELTAYEVIPAPPLFYRTDWTSPSLLFSLCFTIAGFYGIALLASLIAEKLHLARREISERTIEFEKMRALHADVIESMSSGLATVDATGIVTFLNRGGGEILERLPLEAKGCWIWDLGLLSAEEWQSVTSGWFRSPATRGETEIGGERPRTIGYSIRKLKGTAGFLVLFQDLSDVKSLEAEARAREKLAAVGQLAAGIAHEIRNPLASISGSAQMLGNEMRTGSSERRLVEIIVAESRRLSKILEDFLHYARPGAPQCVMFDVGASLSEAMNLFSHSDEVRDHHLLNLQVESAASIFGDPGQVRQIFWNVARNAISAMPDGGILDVTGRVEGDWYSIRFHDTGRGMSPERQEMLFQPFATAFDGGTGLGMAIVRRLVEEHGGRIRVDSRPGFGTAIEIFLPRRTADRAGSSAA